MKVRNTLDLKNIASWISEYVHENRDVFDIGIQEEKTIFESVFYGLVTRHSRNFKLKVYFDEKQLNEIKSFKEQNGKIH